LSRYGAQNLSRARNLSEVGTGTVKNSYGSASLAFQPNLYSWCKTPYLLQAKMAEERITLIVRDAMVDCRRDQLWTRLMTGSPPLSYSEFVHLTTLVQHETLDEVGPDYCCHSEVYRLSFEDKHLRGGSNLENNDLSSLH
jgi:hypothetical protein